jgi:hypothetical protein
MASMLQTRSARKNDEREREFMPLSVQSGMVRIPTSLERYVVTLAQELQSLLCFKYRLPCYHLAGLLIYSPV